MTSPILNIDLHCHSTVSDGALAPREVAARAHANGVDVRGLTDHDEIGGLAEAAGAAGNWACASPPGSRSLSPGPA